jgi:hypothetical protein
VVVLLYVKAFSQEEAFYIQFEDQPLRTILSEIEKKYEVIFSFNDDELKNQRLSIQNQKISLEQILVILGNNTNLSFKQISDRYIIITPNERSFSFVNKLDLVTIRSFLNKGIEKNNDGSFTLKPDKLEILPGLTEPDVLESIQQLPGVLSPNETATGFFVRGGFSDQNRVIWDGINIYHKGHLFGMISPINPNMTSNIKFINKGTNPRYGERLSSVIDISSIDDISDKVKGEIGLNGLNADALLELPVIPEKLNLIAAARSSYTGILETPTFTQLADKVFESTKINQNPDGNNSFYFNDYNLKINYKPNDRNIFSASFIAIENRLDYILQDNASNRIFNDQLDIRNLGYSIKWKKKWSERFEHHFQAFFSDYSLFYNFITIEEQGESNFEKRNSIFDSGILFEGTYKLSRFFEMSLGYEYNLKDVAYAFLSSGDLDIVLDNEDRIVQNHAVFSNLTFSHPKIIDISLGMRVNYYDELDEVRLEPRIQLSKDLSNNLVINATAEVKNQIINEIDETVFSDLSLENNVWRLSDNEEVPIKNSFQTSMGFIYNKKSFVLDFDAYYKKLNDISALSLGFLNPENTGFNIGNQNTFGLDLFLKKNFNNIKTWLSYSFINSENSFENLNNNTSFKAKTNIRHSISTSFVYDLKEWQFSLGWRWQTGRPFTIATEVENSLSFEDGINTGQLPNYHRLDFSTTYNFRLSKSINAKTGLSIRNLYNRRTLISKEYRGNNTLNDNVEAIDRFSVGITPNLMFRLYF